MALDFDPAAMLSDWFGGLNVMAAAEKHGVTEETFRRVLRLQARSFDEGEIYGRQEWGCDCECEPDESELEDEE